MAVEKPILDQFNLVVRDMDAAVSFYRLLGLDIADTDPEWQHRHRTAQMPEGIDLDLDSAEFAAQWNGGWPGGEMGVLGFKVSTRQAVDELFAEITAAGHGSQQPPFDAFWGARYAVVEDPDGNAVGIMSPIDPGMRTTAPAAPS